MKRVAAAVMLLILTACGGPGPKELYETAQFEELQNNHRHAVQLYEEIVRDHPDSGYASKARESLERLKK